MPRVGGGAHERRGERMLGVPLECRDQPQGLVLVEAVDGADRRAAAAVPA